MFALNPGQYTSGQNAGHNCIGGQNAGQFWGRLDKMTGLCNFFNQFNFTVNPNI